MNFLGRIAANFHWFPRRSIDTFPVRVVVTGMEHSGTTLLSLLLKQNPRLNAGFECGFLLADKPRDFKDIHPWYEWMQEPVSEHQWGVSEEHMALICASRNWEEAYRKLLRYSPVFDHARPQQICDKTPRYLCRLDSVLDKLPNFVPCLVIEKDIESLWRSHKKRKSSLEDFRRNYERYYNGLRRALQRHRTRIHRVGYEALCNDLHTCLREIFTIIGLPYKDDYGAFGLAKIQNYARKQSGPPASLSEEETVQLNRLRSQFADL
jgi:hypothetical protein